MTNYAENDTVMNLFQYTYNSYGLRTRVDREDSVLLYEYDTLNRLTRERKIASVKGSSVEFDGSNDYVTFAGDNPNIDGEDELTVELWVRTGSDVYTNNHIICMNGPVRVMTFQNHFAAAVNTENDFWPWIVGSTTITTNTWYHVAVVYDSDIELTKLFVNGSQDGSVSQQGPLDGTGILLFGGYSGGGSPATGSFFGGRIDEVRLSKIWRSVGTLWSNGVYAKPLEADADTVGLWHIDETSGTKLYDAGSGGYDGTFGSSTSAPQWKVEDLWANKFEYDKVGNRTKWYNYVNSSTKTFTYSYNTLNQLTYFFDANASLHKYLTYDKNGNRTRVEAKSNGYLIYDYRYWWDQDDHLIKYEKLDSSGGLLKRVEYRYCRTCAGNRTERIQTDEYGEIIEWLRYEMEGLNHLRIDEKWDSDDDDDIDEYDPFRVQRVYYNGPGQLSQIVKVKAWDYSGQNPNSTDYYYGYDVLGNVSVISNSNGAEADQFEQDAFGNEVESSWSSAVGGITEHLTTKQYDADLGLYYFNARWYDPITVSLISVDLWYYRVNEGRQSLTLYDYARSNPLLYVDPSGTDSIEVCCRTIGVGEGWMPIGVMHCLLKLPGWPLPNGGRFKRRILSLFPAGKGVGQGLWGNGIPQLDNKYDIKRLSDAKCTCLEAQDNKLNRRCLLAKTNAYGTPPYDPFGDNSNTFIRTILTRCKMSFDNCVELNKAAGNWTCQHSSCQ